MKMSCCSIQASRVLLIGLAYILSEVVGHFVDRSTCISSGVGALIYLTGSTLRLDCAEV
jgi:hypothetical protein